MSVNSLFKGSKAKLAYKKPYTAMFGPDDTGIMFLQSFLTDRNLEVNSGKKLKPIKFHFIGRSVVMENVLIGFKPDFTSGLVESRVRSKDGNIWKFIISYAEYQTLFAENKSSFKNIFEQISAIAREVSLRIEYKGSRRVFDLRNDRENTGLFGGENTEIRK